MNESIFLFLNSFVGKNEIFDFIVLFCAQYLAYVVIGVFALYFVYKAIKKGLTKAVIREALIIFGSTFAVWFISQIINYLYYSPRPFIVLDNINVLFTHGGGDSFPSGHTTFFFALAFISQRYVPVLFWRFLIVSAGLIAISRIMGGIHWPYDIVGGITLAFVGIFAIKKFLDRK